MRESIKSKTTILREITKTLSEKYESKGEQQKVRYSVSKRREFSLADGETSPLEEG